MNVCSKCGTELHEDDLIEGCPNCGSKVFKFVNTKAIEEKKRREKEEKENPVSEEEEITLDENSVESVKVEDKGIYELNLPNILEGETDVFSDREGNYAIDIHSILKKGRNENEKED